VELIFEYNQKTKQLEIKGYTLPEGKRLTKAERLQAYLVEAIKESTLEARNRDRLTHYLQALSRVSTRNKELPLETEKERSTRKHACVES
jgi:hypothetical protein